jgi:hypothetical protein
MWDLESELKEDPLKYHNEEFSVAFGTMSSREAEVCKDHE